MEKNLPKILIAAVLVFAALVSMLLMAGWASNQETHAAAIASIDNKVQTVLKLTATSTVASAGISAIPGDTATPIADKLADFTEYFLLVLCVLYSEKYLLTIIGMGTFRILIPLACSLGILSLFWNPKVMQRMALKIAAFGLALFIVIPCSVKVSDMVYETYQGSIQTTIAEAESFSEDTSALSEAKSENLLEAILSKLSTTAGELSNRAAKLLNRFLESLAVMIVTSCVIPVLVLLFFIWLVKLLTGLNIPMLVRFSHPGEALNS